MKKKKSSSLFYLNFRERVYLKTGLEKKNPSIYYTVIE